MKKILIICALVIVLFIVFCFAIGYQLPQRDHHRNWTILEENKDPNYVIEPVFAVNVVIQLEHGTLMLVNTDQIIVINNGAVLRRFNTSDPVYIDKFHNRIITGKPAGDYATSKSINYFSYDLKDFSEQSVNLTNYPLTETFAGFARRKGKNLDYHADSTRQDHLRDSLLIRQYKAAYEKDMLFFATLHPVPGVDDDRNRSLSAKYYTDDSGNVYHIQPLTDTASLSYEAFMNSMDILYPAWLKVPDLSFEQVYSPNFHIADKSTIADNQFDFDPGINFSPGGKDHFIQMDFEQNYLHYYAIRLKDSIVHIKVYDNVPINDETTVNKFMQLNTPQSDRDTLAFIYDSELYKVYRRH